ncbi:BrnA antitoxin family protein [Salinarimonas rosea]|uniref:BrnA antitoxin family protein n=1 Tax=Salinarimonas rosea TaxID=552063 RepID=UPI000419660C|nr:BrnA antitoxin family protein [Salinarimonas rosea]
MVSDPRKHVLDEDNPEWTDEDFAKARPYDELPEDLKRVFKKGRGPQKAPTKRLVSLRLSPDVLERFKASGPGWQTRIDGVLREHMPDRSDHGSVRDAGLEAKYDEEADALFVRVAEGAIVGSEEVRPGLVIDFDASGKIVGFEMLNAHETVAPGAFPPLEARARDER